VKESPGHPPRLQIANPLVHVTQDKEMPVLKSIFFSVVGFCLFLHIPLAAGSQVDACSLPEDLRSEVATKYPGKKVVTLADLQDDDRGFFQKDHNSSCPGLVKADFYGDGKPTLALALIGNGKGKDSSVLIVAHQVEGIWKTNTLATGGPTVPLVWSMGPGEYQDVYGEKKIRATRPVIVFCKYESWTILYSWTGNRVAKIWLQD
jgi:hypothetical protein